MTWRGSVGRATMLLTAVVLYAGSIGFIAVHDGGQATGAIQDVMFLVSGTAVVLPSTLGLGYGLIYAHQVSSA